MKRTSIILAAFLLALVPAAVGLWGNASFSQAVPVSVPPSGRLATPAADDHGGDMPRDRRVEPGDDREARTPVSAPSPSSTDTGRTPHPSSTVDDHGGDRPRDQRTEAGDDRDLRSDDSRHDSDDSGHGSDDSGHGSDDSGHGADDSGSDDSRHGSDHGEDD